MVDYLGNNLMETNWPVGVCRGLLVEGGGTTRRPRRESETASVSKLVLVVDTIELIKACLV